MVGPNRMPVNKIDKDQQVRKAVFLGCLMYEAMTERVAMVADKSLCLWTFPFSFSIKKRLICG